MPAGNKPEVQIEGAKELRRALKRMGESADDLTDTHRKAAERVQAEGERLAPVRSGRLRSRSRVNASKTRAGVTWGRGIKYAAVIHFGWPAHNIAPQPWAYDALDRRRDEVVELYNQRIGELVRRVGSEAP